ETREHAEVPADERPAHAELLRPDQRAPREWRQGLPGQQRPEPRPARIVGVVGERVQHGSGHPGATLLRAHRREERRRIAEPDHRPMLYRVPVDPLETMDRAVAAAREPDRVEVVRLEGPPQILRALLRRAREVAVRATEMRPANGLVPP